MKERAMTIAFGLVLLAIGYAGCAGQRAQVQPNVELEKLPPYTPTGNEPKVAVFDFENASFFESPTLGAGVATMFQTALVQSRRFRVIDRENLNRILEEQKLSASGLTNASLASIGKLLGLDYIITGKVTEFGIKRTGTSVGGGALGLSTFTGGGAKIKRERGTARIAIDVKVTDIKTGQIVYMGSATGEAYSDNVNVGLALLTGSGIGAGASVGQGVQGFDETIAGKAARVAANRMVLQIIKSASLTGQAK